MKKLIRNVIRSFKRNKISILGLIFLVFFGLGAFTIMSNTTANITNEYTSIASKGHLHDLTANEMYEIGSAVYHTEDKWFKYTVDELGYGTPTYCEAVTPAETIITTQLWNSSAPTTSGTYYYVLPTQTITEGAEATTVVREYQLKLDENKSSGLFGQYAVSGPLAKFTFKVTETVTGELPSYVNALQACSDVIKEGHAPTAVQMNAVVSSNFFQNDFNEFNKLLSDQTTLIQNEMTTTNTPLTLHIDQEYANELSYRHFKSINITASGDKIFYKVIESSPEDTIDSMVMFQDPTGRHGNELFNEKDWAPYDSKIIFYDLESKVVPSGKEFEHFTIPSSYEELINEPLYTREEVRNWTDRDERYIYSQLVQIRFKRMYSGSLSDKDEDFHKLLRQLAYANVDAQQYYVELFAGSSSLADAYDEYYAEWYAGESRAFSSNGNIVFTWIILGAPRTLTLSNWTSKFAIINPQHLDKANKKILSSSYFYDFKPFIEWSRINGYTASKDISQSTAIKWLNTLSVDQFNFWVNPSTFKEESMVYELPPALGSLEPQTVTVKKSEWSGLPTESLASVNGYNEIIWGCGLTPDFMYPVVDITRPTPNPATECLTYVNSAGYKSIKLAFINSPVEEYLIARFKANTNTNRQNEIIDELNKFCSEHMLFPKEIKAVYRAGDTSNVLSPAGYRVSYIPSLVSVIQLITTILCSFLGILAFIICLIIIKRYIENNRVNIGIMRANGIKKWKIALSLFPFALLPAVIGGVAAYLFGFFLQAGALTLFKSYWMLPTPLLGFDWISLVACIVAPFVIFAAISFIATFVVLRVKTVELMKPGSEFKTNGFSRIAKKPFKHFGVLTRFRVALAFNSFSRLFMLGTMSCLTMSSLVFAFTTFDKLALSQQVNSSQFNYKFSLELTTPTSSGGVYSVQDYSMPNPDDPGSIYGLGYTNPNQYIFNTAWSEDGYPSEFTKWYAAYYVTDEYKTALGTNSSLMLPGLADKTGQDEDLFYLQNRTSAKLTLDYVIGLPGIAASNPWEIALSLMPANSRNIAADSFNALVQSVGQLVDEAQDKMFENLGEKEWNETNVKEACEQTGKWACYFENSFLWWTLDFGNAFPFYFKGHQEDHKWVMDKPYEFNVKNWPTGFSTQFIKFLRNIYTDADLVKQEYPLSYGVIPMNWDYQEDKSKRDETYTYVTGTLSNLSTKQRKEFDPSHEVKVEGIVENSNFINLTDKNGNELNSLLFSENIEDSHPIIVNAYAAHKYNLKTGSTFTLTANNTADRYERTIHPEKYKDDDSNKAKFRVVGISSGTNGEAFYITQNTANNLLGLPNGSSWNKTHKYVRWQTNINSTATVADLSGLASGNKNNIDIFGFDGSTWKLVESKNKSEYSELSKIPVPVGFNGIYTLNTEGKPIVSGISTYSYTGIYPGVSVYKTESNNKFAQILKAGNNLAVANMLSGINNPKYYEDCAHHIDDPTWAGIDASVDEFINQLKSYYGDTTMVTAIAGAMDVAASDQIYKNLISTFDLAETSIMSVIIPITIIIVGIISNLIITDSRRMAAMLKALGYSDAKNLTSILALFIPSIVAGLLLAVPLSFGLTLGYQSIIFNTANILVDVTQKWWYYVAAVGGIGLILAGTYALGYASMKKARLVDEIK